MGSIGGRDAAGRGAAPGEGDGPDALLAGVLAALRSGRDEGAAALWAALAPRARGPLGGVDGARRALGNELLAPLVAHAAAEVEPWERRGDVARTHVRVVPDAAGAASGEAPALYLVSARRDAEAGWRLTGLRRDDLPWG